MSVEALVPDTADTIMHIRPPFDPLLIPIINSLPEFTELDVIREMTAAAGADSITNERPDLVHEEFSIPGPEADQTIILSVFKSSTSKNTARPALYHVHGGGQIAGNRFTGLLPVTTCFDGIDTVFISVEYRLSPEYPAPAALHDSYTGLKWVVENAAKLGIDASKIILYGISGGGPIAAGTAMMCRNEKKEYPHALMLLTPMLDDRDCTVSSKQFFDAPLWSGIMNRKAWGYVLGKDCGGPNVSELIAPARAVDLTNLPPTFIDAAGCEVFRDEAVAFASQLWKCGVSAELHVLPGAFHGSEMFAPTAPISADGMAARVSWVKRILGVHETKASS